MGAVVVVRLAAIVDVAAAARQSIDHDVAPTVVTVLVMALGMLPTRRVVRWRASGRRNGLREAQQPGREHCSVSCLSRGTHGATLLHLGLTARTTRGKQPG